MPLNESNLIRYDRHIRLQGFGLGGQDTIKAAKVLVIGAGGLGGPALYYLAAAGVGRIGVADGDVVELSNLQRQILHTSADIGRPKTDSAVFRLKSLNPDVSVTTHAERLNADNIEGVVAAYDFVIDATDNFEAKFLINDACVLAGKPFSHAGVVGYRGQTMTVHPKRSACYRCLFEAPPPAGVVETAAQIGVLAPLVGVLGSIQATEAIKHLTRVGEPLTNALLTVDALSLAFRKISLSRNPRCPVCGDAPTIRAIDAANYVV